MENKPIGDKGLLLPTDYSPDDILTCVSDYKIRTGKNQPSKVYIPKSEYQIVSWLLDFDIQVLTGGIQSGTILLV